MPTQLENQNIEEFNQQGFTRPQGEVFTAEKFRRLVAEFNDMLSNLSESRRPEYMDTPHFENRRLLEWALAPELVNLVEPLIGPDIFLFSTHFICKPASTGLRFSWHDDLPYWRGMLSGSSVVTIWLAIDRTTVDNGCMFFIPRSQTRACEHEDAHIEAQRKRRFLDLAMQAGRIQALAVANQLDANECSLHDARTLHASAENTSSARRCGWALRYIPADYELLPTWRAKHVLFLAKGQNLTQQTLGDPTQNYSKFISRQRHGT